MFLRCMSEKNNDNGTLKNKFSELKIEKTTIDESYISFYCTGRFLVLKDYFLNIKIDDISHGDTKCLFQKIDADKVLLLRVFCKYMNKLISKQRSQYYCEFNDDSY